jgi:hypothetical protein
LEIAKRKKLISQAQTQALYNQLETIVKMISGLINGMENREK